MREAVLVELVAELKRLNDNAERFLDYLDGYELDVEIDPVNQHEGTEARN